jgi:Tol biopolymer transport system component
VVTLCDVPDSRGAAWGQDDNIIATLNSSPATGLSRVPAAGGTPRELTHPGMTGEATHRWPQFLPGGHAVLFTGNKTASNYDDASIEVLSLKTGQVKVLQHGGYFGRYIPGGYLVYIHRGSLFGVRFNLDRLEVEGGPALLQEDVAGNPTNAGGQFDFSNNGTMVYLSGRSSSGTWTLEWLDKDGKTQPLLAEPGIYFNPRLSPDGQRVAYSTNSAIEIYDWRHDTTTQLTFTADTQTNLDPVWTPDERHIVFVSQGTSTFSLQWIRVDGSGQVQRLLESKNELVPRSFSRDGKVLAFEARSPETGLDLWTLPLELSDPDRPKPGKPELFLGTPFTEEEPAFSPDGSWIAYVSNESGQSEVYVQSFPLIRSTGAGKWLISAAGGHSPIWSPEGRELFYRGPDGRIMTVSYIAKGESFVAGKPSPWSNAQIGNELDVAPGGERFVVEASPHADSAHEPKPSVRVTFLLNFFDEVRRRLPRGVTP